MRYPGQQDGRANGDQRRRVLEVDMERVRDKLTKALLRDEAVVHRCALLLLRRLADAGPAPVIIGHIDAVRRGGIFLRV
jgi:hypothetical protein